jgi:hypothetical protein
MTTDTPLVTDEQIAFFREHGYLHYGPLFTEQEKQELRDEIQAFIDDKYPDCYRTDLWTRDGEAQQPRGKERFLQMCGLFNHSDVIKKYAVQRKRGEIVARLVGCDSIQLLSDMILYKPPGKGNSRPSIWHQDYPSGPNTEPDITSWMPLDDVDETNGCMQYLPGTQKFGELTPPGQENRENYEKAGIDFSNPAIVPMKAGEVVFHHSNIIHYSSENISERPRRVYITRFMPGTARYRWRAEIEHLYEGWNLKQRQGQPFPADEFPMVYQ